MCCGATGAVRGRWTKGGVGRTSLEGEKQGSGVCPASGCVDGRADLASGERVGELVVQPDACLRLMDRKAKGAVLATKAVATQGRVETQGKGTVLATKAAERHAKGSVFATKVVKTKGKGRYLGPRRGREGGVAAGGGGAEVTLVAVRD